MDGSHDLVKVLLSNEDGDVERMWARPLGGNQYQLDNIPWYAYGVSCGDVIEARADDEATVPSFVRVVEKRGNRTVRIAFEWPARGANLTQRVLDYLSELGCQWEGMSGKLIAVSIPPATDFSGVCEYLTNKELRWEHADPPYKELYPDDDGD